MSPIIVGVIGFAILFAIIAIGFPIGFGMAAVGFAGLWYLISANAALIKVATTTFSTITSYDLAVLPFFLLMAHVCFHAGLSKDLYDLAAKWLGHQPGGIAMATVGACAGFAAVSGSSIATASTFGLVAYPEMIKYKYDPSLATGSIAAGGTMGILIPPSAVLIIYGVITETSIGKLFIGGIIPGLIEALFYIIAIYVLCTWKPVLGPRGPSFSFREKVFAFGSCGEIIGLIVLVLGGLIIGWFTPTEAGAVGAFGAILFSLIRRRLSWGKFMKAAFETIKTTGMVYCILIGAMIFTYFVAVTTIPIELADFVGGLPLPPLAIMVIIVIVYIFLGSIMDAMAMILLTIPIFYPLAVHLGFDPIWFGIIIVAVVEIGMITPPIGMNVYVISGITNQPLQTVFKGIIPFLIADFCRTTLYLFVPSIVLFLPSLLG
jgi:C4-dicarboxylate transporter DctM subunit